VTWTCPIMGPPCSKFACYVSTSRCHGPLQTRRGP
jgi:hypothetical protein